ncbi:hypothetical protein KEM48_011296 [Puccinia striiformis f. sp. tritici PST-130]|nr:hypothetical protein KEM48_011296 [Puccinia striiformis f. sp. tritici PST-130]
MAGLNRLFGLSSVILSPPEHYLLSSRQRGNVPLPGNRCLFDIPNHRHVHASSSSFIRANSTLSSDRRSEQALSKLSGAQETYRRFLARKPWGC